MTHPLPEAPTSASPRQDWAQPRAYAPDPAKFLQRPADPFAPLPRRLTWVDVLAMCAVAALIGFWLAVGGS